MSTPALRKHYELMERLGVRTVVGAPRVDQIEGPGGRTVADTKLLHEKIQALIAKGLRNFEIAAELGISGPTVGRHRRGLVKALQK